MSEGKSLISWGRSYDCRTDEGLYRGIEIPPWVAFSSLHNWGIEALTNKDLSDGETTKTSIFESKEEKRPRRPKSFNNEDGMCDISGTQIWSTSDLESDFNPGREFELALLMLRGKLNLSIEKSRFPILLAEYS